MPGDDPARQLLPRDAYDALRQALGADATEQPAEADVGTDEPQLAVDFGELQVVHAHDLRAVRVDDLLVHEVAREAQRLLRQLRVGDRVEATAQPEMPDLLRQLVPADYSLAARGGEDRPLHRRELALRDDREVSELRDLGAIRLDHASMLDVREVRHARKGTAAG